MSGNEQWDAFLQTYKTLSADERKRAVEALSTEQRQHFQSLLQTRTPPVPAVDHSNFGLNHNRPGANVQEVINSDLKSGQDLVIKFALAAAAIGLIPLSSLILIPVEVLMIYQLSRIYHVSFGIQEFGAVVSFLWIVSNILFVAIGLVFSFVVGAGWVVKALIAFGFVWGFGAFFNKWYSMEKRKRLSAALE